MKLTKKQIAAIKLMISYERDANERYKRDGGAGLHPSVERGGDKDKFVVTDGIALVIFDEQPDGLELMERNDFYAQFADDLERADRSAVRASIAPTVQECKQAISEWKKMTNLGKPQIPRVKVVGVDEQGNQMESCFDARHLLNAMEATGSSVAVFIGRDGRHKLHFPYVTIYKEVGRAPYKDVEFRGTKAIVLPCRPE